MGKPSNPQTFPDSASSGMTLRDYFAGQALAGFAASPLVSHEWVERHAVSSAYSLADAMLARRERT